MDVTEMALILFIVVFVSVALWFTRKRPKEPKERKSPKVPKKIKLVNIEPGKLVLKPESIDYLAQNEQPFGVLVCNEPASDETPGVWMFDDLIKIDTFGDGDKFLLLQVYV